MTDFSTVNFFRDRAVQDDPYPYFDWVRSQHPVWQEPHHGVYLVSGHAEAKEIYRAPATSPVPDEPPGACSSCNAVRGPFVRFPVPVEDAEDVSALIPRYRHELP